MTLQIFLRLRRGCFIKQQRCCLGLEMAGPRPRWPIFSLRSERFQGFLFIEIGTRNAHQGEPPEGARCFLNTVWKSIIYIVAFHYNRRDMWFFRKKYYEMGLLRWYTIFIFFLKVICYIPISRFNTVLEVKVIRDGPRYFINILLYIV